MRELHSHCQCDQCSGVDCGQDDPEAYEQSQKEGREAIKKEERERVLDGAYKRLQSICTDTMKEEGIPAVFFSDIDSLFVELRGGKK